jgi:hypothetical protein
MAMIPLVLPVVVVILKFALTPDATVTEAAALSSTLFADWAFAVNNEL